MASNLALHSLESLLWPIVHPGQPLVKPCCNNLCDVCMALRWRFVFYGKCINAKNIWKDTFCEWPVIDFRQAPSLGLTCLRVPVEPPLPMGTPSYRLVENALLVRGFVWDPIIKAENEHEELHNQALGGYPCTSCLVTHANLQRCLAWYLVPRYRLPLPCKIL
jgi:hypothetical protein